MSDAPLGIDLGTTFSVVAQVNGAGTPVVLPNSEGSPTTPSVVLFDGDTAVVGAVARESLATDPDRVVQLVKRHMGSQWLFEYHGTSFRPQHLSSLILRKLVHDAQLLTGTTGPVSAAVTVPAYFNDTMRLATRRAGELAGLEVLGLLSEPTAAAIAFGYEKRPSGTLGVVVDFGGGTFDVTVMSYDGSDLTVRATGGDAYLGGANLDKALFDHFVVAFTQAHGLDINDPDALTLDEYTQVSQSWLAKANRAKHDLSVRDKTTVALQAAGLTLRLDVPREMFLTSTRVLLDEMSEKIVDVVAAAGVEPNDIGLVLAVGGTTRVPAVRDRIIDIFGTAPDTTVRPDEAVALGASLFAAQRQLELGGSLTLEPAAQEYLEKLTITDVASHSLGVSIVEARPDGSRRTLMTPLLPRNVALPFTTTKSFYTVRPNETQILVPVLEGEDADPELCHRIGLVTIDGLPAGRPPGQEVVVSMTLDRDGILEVSAKDVASGAQAATRIRHETTAQDSDTAVDDAVRRLNVV